MSRQMLPQGISRVLIIGSGGREGASAWKIKTQHPEIQLFCAPGNAGIERHAVCVSIAATDIEKIVAFATMNHIDLVIVGPEVPLVGGLTDRLTASGILVCGPSAQAARMTEGSKVEFKNFLTRHDLPTARYRVFTDADKALEYVKERGPKAIVIKADGLAAGKGVKLPETLEDAEADIIEIQKKYGKLFLIEDRLDGEEFSETGVTDGTTTYSFTLTQDNKRRHAGPPGPKNPNTGGMGARTVTLSPEREQEAHDLLWRVVDALRSEGILYRGFVYLGLMLTAEGFKILEMNCRLGDPETEVILPSIDGDFLALCAAAAKGNLLAVPAPCKIAESVCVALVSKEYPESSSDDVPISGIEEAEEAHALVIHASTAKKNGVYTTNRGGRIIYVIGTAPTLKGAAMICHVAAPLISTPAGLDRRQDILDRALGRSA